MNGSSLLGDGEKKEVIKKKSKKKKNRETYSIAIGQWILSI